MEALPMQERKKKRKERNDLTDFEHRRRRDNTLSKKCHQTASVQGTSTAETWPNPTRRANTWSTAGTSSLCSPGYRMIHQDQLPPLARRLPTAPTAPTAAAAPTRHRHPIVHQPSKPSAHQPITVDYFISKMLHFLRTEVNHMTLHTVFVFRAVNLLVANE